MNRRDECAHNRLIWCGMTQDDKENDQLLAQIVDPFLDIEPLIMASVKDVEPEENQMLR